MAVAALESFSCEVCDRKYAWKPALAGRRVKCKCGAILVCPQQISVEQDLLYDLVEAPAPVKVAVPVPLAYRVPSEDPGTMNRFFPNRTMDLHAPLWLVCGSFLTEIIATILFWPLLHFWPVPLTDALVRITAEMIVGTAIMLGGIFAAAKLRGIELGSLRTAALKLAAVSLAPHAAMMLLIVPLAFIPLGGLIVWIIGFCLYFALLGAMFQLDESDTWYCVIVIFVLRLLIAGGVYLLHLALG